MELNLTRTGFSTYVARLLVDGPAFRRTINITTLDGGKILFLLAMEEGALLTPEQWREAAAEHFPQAQWVVWRRVNKAGRESLHTLALDRQPSAA